MKKLHFHAWLWKFKLSEIYTGNLIAQMYEQFSDIRTLAGTVFYFYALYMNWRFFLLTVMGFRYGASGTNDPFFNNTYWSGSQMKEQFSSTLACTFIFTHYTWIEGSFIISDGVSTIRTGQDLKWRNNSRARWRAHLILRIIHELKVLLLSVMGFRYGPYGTE